jgi:hypothetical protein
MSALIDYRPRGLPERRGYTCSTESFTTFPSIRRDSCRFQDP